MFIYIYILKYKLYKTKFVPKKYYSNKMYVVKKCLIHSISSSILPSNFTMVLIMFSFLNLQSVSFASLLPSLFENMELQLLAELSSVGGVVLRHGSGAN